MNSSNFSDTNGRLLTFCLLWLLLTVPAEREFLAKAEMAFSIELNVAERSESCSSEMAPRWASFSWKGVPTKEFNQGT